MMRSALFLLLLGTSTAHAGQEVRICYESAEHKPFMMGQGERIPSPPGILIDLISMAFEGSELEPRYFRRPWKRCMREVRENRMDGFFATIWTAERDKWAVYPRTAKGKVDRRLFLWDVTYPVYVKRGSTLNWDGKSFTGLKVGIGSPPGYVATQRLKKMQVYARHIHLPDAERGLRMVAMGRIDGYVLNRITARGLLPELQLESELTTLDPPFMQSLVYLAFSKEFSQHRAGKLREIWENLRRVRLDHSEALMSRYQASK
ncbi:substrate-binding periplasmic protein [Dongshaea marina]|uniref:substrate-binding periplasmic protein n=1 Tax=Dongshaea marina TaxID=2047966 RepID=UPI00131F3BFA|nr:transporter substrate-binding domain-containing protein [Dongshaea marina]